MQIAHQETYKGHSKEQLQALNIWVEGSDEVLGASWRRGAWNRFGKVKQNWAEEKGRW